MNDDQPTQEVDTSEDDNLTEATALEQAEEQGITFIDEFNVIEISTYEVVAGPFETREEADDALAALEIPAEHTVSQSRRQG